MPYAAVLRRCVRALRRRRAAARGAVPGRAAAGAWSGVAALVAPLILVAACGSEPDPSPRIAARRAALGLGGGPIPFGEAMKRLEAKAYEGLLARVGSKGLRADEALDAAVEIEDLLARADPATAEARPPSPPVFDARLADARERARALSRTLALGGSGKAEAADLFGSCVACHITFRTPR